MFFKRDGGVAGVGGPQKNPKRDRSRARQRSASWNLDHQHCSGESHEDGAVLEAAGSHAANRNRRRLACEARSLFCSTHIMWGKGVAVHRRNPSEPGEIRLARDWQCETEGVADSPDPGRLPKTRQKKEALGGVCKLAGVGAGSHSRASVGARDGPGRCSTDVFEGSQQSSFTLTHLTHHEHSLASL